MTLTPTGAVRASPESRSTTTAVALGLGAVLGVGVLLGPATATALAGRPALPAVLLAALTALCCAFSSADQHRVDPGAGGGYGHVRNHLGAWPARIGGSAFLVGRAGVAAALAAAFAEHVFPDQRWTAALAVLGGTAALGAAGLRWSTRASRVAAAFVVVVLLLVVLLCFSVAPPPAAPPAPDTPAELVGAAGLMVVAFTGFERITAPVAGDPVFSARRLRVAVPVLVGITLLVVLGVLAALQHQLGTARLALSPAPLRDATNAADAAWLVPLVQFAAGVAAVSALHALFAGNRRTLAAMAGNGDLPPRLAAARRPWRLDLLTAAGAVLALVLLTPAQALAVGACGTLFHHAFSNAAARILLQEDHTWPLRTACAGLGLSVLLAMSLPVHALLVTFSAVAAGTALTGLCSALGVRRRARLVSSAAPPPGTSGTAGS
ncbi:amino acid permease [Umezawaea beigongshangensis]|uniref:amino acid permease n=1 Tax=Umezawaea beigongshangensis TaxID=2780383 RepID=UPI0018F1CD38|nr:amino acid permease [Umezawaea beigongshangensis]